MSVQENFKKWNVSKSDKDLVKFKNSLVFYLNKYLLGRKIFNSDVREEAISNTFFQIWKHINEYDENISQVTTWATHILTNELYNINSQKKRLSHHKNIWRREFVEDEWDEEEFQQNLELVKSKMKSIGTLGFVLEEIFLKEIPQHQFAKTYNINLNTVKTWTKRGKEIVRYMIEKDVDKFKYSEHSNTTKIHCPYCGIKENKQLMKLHMQICDKRPIKV